MLPIIVIVLYVLLWIAAVIASVMANWAMVLLLFAAILSYTALLFKGTLNTLQVAGRVYWITRDLVPPNTPRCAKAFMRETSSPWRTGRGIQIRGLGRTFQIGICDKGMTSDEIEGLAHAVGGRLLEETPHKIGNW